MINTADYGVHVFRSMVFKWHKRFREGQESIDDDEITRRPTEIVDAMIDDIRHVVQEGGHAPFFHSAVSVPIVHLHFLILVFQSKLYVLLLWISQTTQKFPLR